MSRNHLLVPASALVLKMLIVFSALAFAGALYTGHDGMWSLSIVLSLYTLAAFSRGDESASTKLAPKLRGKSSLRAWPASRDGAAVRKAARLRLPSPSLFSHLSKTNFPMLTKEKKSKKPASASRNPVVLTQEDYNTLRALAAGQSPASEMSLAHELARAIIVRREALPPHTVRLTSRVTVQDLDTGREMSFSIVTPGAADMRQNKISILTPMGTALIGFRAGEEVEWQVPAGTKRFKILDVQNAALVAAA